MKFIKTFQLHFKIFLTILFMSAAVFMQSCSTFNYKTYDEKANENIDDPEPDYQLTLSDDFQNYTNFMFIGNRVENFGTYFNTFFNAKENYYDAYNDYIDRTLANYGQSIDSVTITASLSQESIDKFNKAIEKASKVIQFHKSSAFMDQAVLMAGKCYYFLGDNIKAERKFSEFISKLSNSKYYDEAVLYYAKTQLRLNNVNDALDKIEDLTKNSKDNSIKAQAYQSIAEYYLSLKDYESAIINFNKSIDLSSDEEFKAQMQFLIASVVAQSDPKKAPAEFNKVLNFRPKYEIEYLAKYNSLKYSILSNDKSAILTSAEKLQVKYKDVPEYVSQVEYMKGKYYTQKNDYTNALTYYDNVILTYPKSQPSSDASFDIAQYYEKQKNDYLNAFRFYRFSTEESSSGHNALTAAAKVKTYKRYFELKSLITGKLINTDYDSTFIGKQLNKNQDGTPSDKGTENGNKNNNGDNGNTGQHNGKPGGEPGSLNNLFPNTQANLFIMPADSLVDSTAIKNEAITKAKFELAELFFYDLQRPDSCEYYLSSALDQSKNYDFKSKVLFAMADLYKSTGQIAKSDEVLNRILKEYPLSPVVNDTRKLLNLGINDDVSEGAADSLYFDAENKFVKKDYPEALDGFKSIINNYKDSKYTDKSIYAAGWIYENVMFKPDSAYIYYSEIVASYPKSEIAAAVFEKVDEYKNAAGSHLNDTSSTAKDSAGKRIGLNPVNDSAGVKNILKDSTGMNLNDTTGIKRTENIQPNENKTDEINPKNKIQDVPQQNPPIENPIDKQPKNEPEKTPETPPVKNDGK